VTVKGVIVEYLKYWLGGHNGSFFRSLIRGAIH
jgi:hypothetical protein